MLAKVLDCSISEGQLSPNMTDIGNVNDRFHDDLYHGRDGQRSDVVLRERSAERSDAAGGFLQKCSLEQGEYRTGVEARSFAGKKFFDYVQNALSTSFFKS